MTALDSAAALVTTARTSLPSHAPTASAAARDAPEVMNAEQLAAFLGVNRKTVYEYAARRLIPHRRLGRRLMFARAHVLAWLDDAKRTTARA